MAETAVNKYQVVAIGGSAGSLDAILKIASCLPLNCTASIIIIVHRKNDIDSILSDLISSRTGMAIKEVEDKQPLLPATIFLAPSDYHLLVENKQTFSLDGSEKIHFSRPSIDVTFQSVSEVFGASAIGVLLSGANADGAEGLLKIKQAGGLTLVQNPASAEVDFMPRQAVILEAASEILDADDIAERLNRLLQ